MYKRVTATYVGLDNNIFVFGINYTLLIKQKGRESISISTVLGTRNYNSIIHFLENWNNITTIKTK